MTKFTKEVFLETVLTLLEDQLDKSVKRRYRDTGRVVLRVSDLQSAVRANCSRISKEDLVELLISDISHEVMRKLSEGWFYVDDLPATAYSDCIIIQDQKESEDIFGHDAVKEKIVSFLTKKPGAVLSEVVKALKHPEMIIDKKLEELERDEVIRTKIVQGEIFDRKQCFIAEDN